MFKSKYPPYIIAIISVQGTPRLTKIFSQDVSTSNHTQQHYYEHAHDPEISVLFRGICKQKWTEMPFEFTQDPSHVHNDVW